MTVKSFRCLIVAVVVLSVAGFGSSALAVENKPLTIATINIPEVLSSSKAGQDARKIMEDEVQKLQASINKDQEAMEELRLEIDKKSTVWSVEAVQEKEREYQRKTRELQISKEDAQFKVQQLEKKLMEPIAKDLQAVIDTVGRKRGYSMILDSRMGLLFVDDALDISDEIRKELDAQQNSQDKTK